MILSLSREPSWLRTHWFFLAAAVVLAGDITAASVDTWETARLLEAALLVDLAIVVPLLYLWCYRSLGRKAKIKALALSCLGIWFAGHLVPAEHQYALGIVGFFRYLGLAVLVFIELQLIFMIYRVVFTSEASAQESAAKLAMESGIPPWAARIMAWEASLWRKAWEFVKKRVG